MRAMPLFKSNHPNRLRRPHATHHHNHHDHPSPNYYYHSTPQDLLPSRTNCLVGIYPRRLRPMPILKPNHPTRLCWLYTTHHHNHHDD